MVKKPYRIRENYNGGTASQSQILLQSSVRSHEQLLHLDSQIGNIYVNNNTNNNNINQNNQQPMKNNEPIDVDQLIKLRKHIMCLSAVLGLGVTGLFLGFFLYYLLTQLLIPAEFIIPNHYIVTAVNYNSTSLDIYAKYTGQQQKNYPNIYSNIHLNLHMNSTLSSPFYSFSIQQQSPNQNQEQLSYHRKRTNKINKTNIQDIPESPTQRLLSHQQVTFGEITIGQITVQYPQINSKLALILIRTETEEKIFDTLDFDILCSQFFTTIGSFMPTGNFYGLGERRSVTFEQQRSGSQNCTYGHCNKYLFWNRNPNQKDTVFDSGAGSGALEGYQPLYLVQEQSSLYSLLALVNSNSGLEIDYYNSTNESSTNETFVFNNYMNTFQFNLFLGDTNPNTAITVYHSTIQGFSLIPFWAMGYSQGMNGITEIEEMNEFIASLTSVGLPIDAIWTDLTSYNLFNQFDLLNPELINHLRTEFNLKWVPIIPYSISAVNPKTQKYITAGTRSNAFILSNKTNHPIQAETFAGRSNFIDFNSPNALALWTTALSDLFAQAEFDGIYLFRNEPATTLTGEYIFNTTSNEYSLNTSNGYFGLIYGAFSLIQLNDCLLSADALHYNGPDAPYFYDPTINPLYERDIHTRNGYMQSSTTKSILTNTFKMKQPFIVSGSNMQGSGYLGGHLQAAPIGTWEVLQQAFPQLFNFQLFAIPFTTLPACTFGESSKTAALFSELCARWYQASSVFPIMHTSNPEFISSLNIFSFQDYPYVLASAVESTQQRYSLLKHYYSEYVFAQGLGMVFKPLIFAFPEMSQYSSISINTNSTAILGDSLFIFVVTTAGDPSTNSTEVKLSVPPGLWVLLTNPNFQYRGPFQTKQRIPFKSPPLVFLREGHLLLWQNLLTAILIQSTSLGHDFSIRSVLQLTNQNGLTITYSSSGRTLGILDPSNADSIAKCQSVGCQVNLIIAAVSTNNNSMEITISSSLKEDGTTYFEPGITISSITLSGIMKYSQNYIKDQVISEPYDLVSVSQTISPPIVLNSNSMTYSITISF